MHKVFSKHGLVGRAGPAQQHTRCPTKLKLLYYVPSCESAACELDSHLGNQLTRKPQTSSKGKLFVRVRFGGVPSIVEKGVRVQFCCSPRWKTNMGNTGGSVLGYCPREILRKILKESVAERSSESEQALLNVSTCVPKSIIDHKNEVGAGLKMEHFSAAIDFLENTSGSSENLDRADVHRPFLPC